jgi:hypothetical protein
VRGVNAATAAKGEAMTDVPTQEEIFAAFNEGRKAHGISPVTHFTGREHRCKYKHGEHHPDLILAWLQGFDVARARAAS